MTPMSHRAIRDRRLPRPDGSSIYRCVARSAASILSLLGEFR